MSVQLEKAIAFREIEPPAADQALQESKRLVAVALQEIRSTMNALRETEAESSPLRSLVELARTRDHGDLSVELNIDGDENQYSRQALMTLYRAAQEGLTNVQKHAEARHVVMKVEFGEETARLEIKDDGKGFATEQEGVLPDRVGEIGYGLQSMRERLELIGGSLRVVSKPGAGTELHISVPKKSSVQSGQLRIEGSVLSHAQARV
jgi:signal transduction histidine kinase